MSEDETGSGDAVVTFWGLLFEIHSVTGLHNVNINESIKFS